MFEGTDSVLIINNESFPSKISYKSFKTLILPMQNSYCDHRKLSSILYFCVLTSLAVLKMTAKRTKSNISEVIQ